MHIKCRPLICEMVLIMLLYKYNLTKEDLCFLFHIHLTIPLSRKDIEHGNKSGVHLENLAIQIARKLSHLEINIIAMHQKKWHD